MNETRFNKEITEGDIILFPRAGIGSSSPDIVVGVVWQIVPGKRHEKRICLETYEYYGGKEYCQKVRIANAYGSCVINNLVAKELKIPKRYIERSLEIKSKLNGNPGVGELKFAEH